MEEQEGRKPGRPVKWTPTARAELLDALIDYIESTNIPSLADFSFRVKVDRANLYKFDELLHAIKMLMAKKEAFLEELLRQGGKDAPPVAGTIFSLKQLGWKDVQSIEHSGAIDFYTAMTPDERKARIEELEKKHAAHG